MWLLGLATLALPCAARVAAEDGSDRPERGSTLASEQADIKEVLVDLAQKMEGIARTVGATDEDDAEKLRDAAEKIRTTRLPEMMDVIRRLLVDEDFVEALTRQNVAMRELDAVIALLEERQFDEAPAGGELERLRRKREETTQLVSRQRTLLDDTRRFLETLEGLESVQALKEKLGELSARQEALLDAGDGSRPRFPELDADREALQRTAAEIATLERAQARVNAELAALPDDGELEAGTSLEKELARLGREAEELLEKTAELATGTKATPGADETEGAKPPSSEDGSPGSAGDGAPQAAGADDREGTSPEAPAGEGTPPGDVEGEATEDAGPPEAGKEAPPAGGTGESPKNLARRAERLAELLDDLSGRLAALPPGPGAERTTPEEGGGAGKAREAVSEAAQKAREAQSALESGSLGAAQDREEETVQALARARSALSRRFRDAAGRNARETAGLRQEEARLSSAAQEGAQDARERAENATGEPARSALSEAGTSLERASEALREAERALDDGNRAAARQKGKEAADRLRAAREAARAGEGALERQSSEDRSRDLQRKLARDTEETVDETDRLERKLRRTEPEEASRLPRARESLRDAARRMRRSEEARRAGDTGLERKLREEALERLRRAEKALEEEQTEQLARLERRKLRENAAEQGALADDTRRAAREASRDASSGEKPSGRLDDAAGKMDQAAQELGQEQAGKAEESQREALAELEREEEDLRREEERLAELEREQTMVSLVRELEKVRVSQEEINSRIMALDSTREPDESRTQRLKVKRLTARLAEEEDAVASQVKDLGDALEKETARVFTFMLRNAESDMREIRDLLVDLETGAYTQLLGRDVVLDLDRLLAALRAELEELKRRAESQDQAPQEQLGGAGASGGERLVSVMAELLMLRELQEDVNRQTRRLEDLRQAQRQGGPGEVWDRALERISQKQGSISAMTTKIAEDFQAARQTMDGGADGGEEELPTEGEE